MIKLLLRLLPRYIAVGAGFRPISAFGHSHIPLAPEWAVRSRNQQAASNIKLRCKSSDDGLLVSGKRYICYSLFLVVSHLSYMSPSNDSVKRVVCVRILRPRSRLCSEMDKALIPVATGANAGIATYQIMSFSASATELIRLERSNHTQPY